MTKLLLILLNFSFLFPLFGSSQGIANFQLEDVSGKMVSLDSYIAKKAVVLVFTGVHCIYSKKYEQRLIDMANEYNGKNVEFLLINSNNPELSPGDDLESMKRRSESKNYPFPFLSDKRGKLAATLGIEKIPAAMVLAPSEAGFEIIFSGPIDDNPLSSEGVKNNYLKTSLDNILGGKSNSVTKLESTGCSIK